MEIFAVIAVLLLLFVGGYALGSMETLDPPKEPDIEAVHQKYEEFVRELNIEIGQLRLDRDLQHHNFVKMQEQFINLEAKYAVLQHQKISADVKLGQKAEVLLPFLDQFPYKDDYIVGMYNPIDLVVFKDDEIVFVEVKSGQSQLSTRQKQIRDNIKAGKVRFEVHRMNEKGVTVK